MYGYSEFMKALPKLGQNSEAMTLALRHRVLQIDI